MKVIMQRCVLLGLLALLSACSSLNQWQFNQKHGQAVPTTFNQPKVPQPGDVRYSDVKTILEGRCAVCHGCYDAPCQMKLTAWEGIARGATDVSAYATRLSETQPTRLFEDAFTASAWRKMGFHAVLNERPTMSATEGSVLAQLLLLKEKNPLPDVSVLPSEQFDFSLGRQQQCTTIENFTQFSKNNPLWGMPFGLHGLEPSETKLILSWIEQGAPREPNAPINPKLSLQISQWETWLNQDSPKAQLVARYIYEHLFLAHLYFGEEKSFFKLVRSRTPSGQAVDLIASRRPYDDPGVVRPYYRIIPVEETILSKTHMPYRLDADKMAKWNDWFVKAQFSVSTLPSYAPEVASNPFITFAPIPIDSRYRFMLEEAQFTVMGFIKGPVCRGQIAVDVINDHFWVFFNDPNDINNTENAQFLAENSQNLKLPASSGSNTPLIGDWKQYAEGQMKFLAAKRQFTAENSQNIVKANKSLIWNGIENGQKNQNAALTIFRNFDNATVVKGLVGTNPQTAWVIGYPLLERFHYLLVAGFDVFGDVGHQLQTRLYMDFLRIEGEQNFLAMLPSGDDIAMEQHWYRNAPDSTLEFVAASRLDLNPALRLKTEGETPDQAYSSLLKKLSKRMAPVNDIQHDLSQIDSPSLRQALQQLQSVRGSSLQWLPQVTLIEVIPKQGKSIWVTLLNNTAYTNVAQIFFADKRRLPAEDTLTLTLGVVGSYPNAFMQVNESELDHLSHSIAELNSEKSYSSLLNQYGIRRTNSTFWVKSDQANQFLREHQGIYSGLLDLNRLENR